MAGFLGSTINLTRLVVKGDITDDLVLYGLAASKFTDDEINVKQLNVGFCKFFDMSNSEFTHIEQAKIDDFYVFGVRIDTRKVSSSLFKLRVAAAEKKHLEQNPGLKIIPRYIRSEIKESIREELILEAQPSPAMYQVAWDTGKDEVLIATRKKGAVETIRNLFCHVFPTVQFRSDTPIDRSIALTDKAEDLNMAREESVYAAVRDNIQLWQDFFVWLLYRSYNTVSPYSYDGVEFSAELDGKFVLNGDGKRKVSVTGPQGKLNEIRAALSSGMTIDEVMVHIDTVDTGMASVVLDSEWLGISGAKIPFDRPLPDPSGNKYADDVASFVIRMGEIDRVQMMLDALLVDYVNTRADQNSWDEYLDKCTDWITGE